MPNYILRIDGRADQKVSNDVGLGILKQLGLKQSSVTLTIEGKTIGYFNTKDITLVAETERADNTEMYEENSKRYREKQEKKMAWVAEEVKKLSKEQKDFLIELAQHCFPFIKDLFGPQKNKAIRRYGYILLCFIRNCPFEDYNTAFWKGYQFKPLNQYTLEEIEKQYGKDQRTDLNAMFNFPTEITPQWDISILNK